MSSSPDERLAAIPAGPEGVDLFLSYNTLDHDEVRTLYTRLTREGVKCWFDKPDLHPGSHWLPIIEKAIREATAVAVCVGPNGLGPVQEQERQVGLAAALADPAKLIIPVYLPSAPPRTQLPELLRIRTWVDLRGADSSGEFRGLVNAALRREQTPLLPSGECPYRGLLPFFEKHAGNFFGRDPEISHCLRRLRESNYFFLLLGASGSGKSSLVFAGLLPRIKRGEFDGTDQWTEISIRPGARPAHALALPLAKLQQLGARELDRLRQDILESDSVLFDSLELILYGEEKKVLLVVDQFEELFTMTKEAEERAAFIRNIVHAVDAFAGRLYLIVTLRSDFLTKAIECNVQLAERLRGFMDVALSQLSEPQLRDVILRPAYRAGLTFDTGLADVLVEEISGEPGGLPLLQFVLEELWHERAGDRMTWDAYKLMGGIKGALSRRADEVSRRFAAPEQEKLFRQIICRLVNIGGEAPDTRQRVSLAELRSLAPEEAPQILDDLIASRLVTANESTIEIAHESLISHWPQLQLWIRQDRDALRLRQQLASAVAEWADGGRDEDLLFRGQRLHFIESSIEKCGSERSIVWSALTPLQVEFLEQSRALRTREASAENRQLRLSDIYRLSVLEREAHENLWPPFQERLERIHRWLRSAEAMAASLEEHEADLRELRALGKASPQGEWTFANAEDQWQHDTLLGLTTALRSFVDPRPENGTLQNVRRRCVHASEGQEEKARAFHLGWAQAPDAAGFAVPPELASNLHFLGLNPASGRAEFVYLFSGRPPAPAANGLWEMTSATGMVLALLPAGAFSMGAQNLSADESNYDPAAAKNEGPVHTVSLHPFLISKYEVTRAQWLRIADTDMPAPGESKTSKDPETAGREPIANISWREGYRTIQRLGLDLPTEAQWEYAARGGTTTPWWTGADKQSLAGAANLASQTAKTNGGPANWDYEAWETGFSRTAPVGSFRPNPFGLHDILGNVWEWCCESWRSYTDPPREGDGRRGNQEGDMVSRGGGFYDTTAGLRCAFRSWRGPDYRDHDVGIRPVINLVRLPPP